MGEITTSILAAVIYDLIKKGFSYRKITDKLSKQFGLNSSQSENINNFLQKYNISENQSCDFIINALEKDTNIQFIIDKVNNINIHSNNTNIIFGERKEISSSKLEDLNVTYRNWKLDIWAIYFLLFSTSFILMVSSYFHLFALVQINYALPLYIIFIVFFYLVLLPKFTKFMYVTVHNDRIIYENKCIKYSEIKNYGYDNNGTFKYRLHSSKNFKMISLHNEDNAFVIYDAINNYRKIKGISND